MPPVLEPPAPDAEVREITDLDIEQPQLADTHGGGPRHPGADDDRGGGGGDDGSGDPDPNYVPGAGLLAMRFVMVSVAMLFLTVGMAYFARSATHKNWQHIRVPHLLWISTALILASGWTLEIGRNALQRASRVACRSWVGATVAIGVAFVACQVSALRELMQQGIYMQGNPHGSLFYVLTGTHAMHLFGGILALCYLLVSVSGRRASDRRQAAKLRSRAGVTALYWHFLTVLWLGLFLALLFWP